MSPSPVRLSRRGPPPNGFTLVELMVVIFIIGLLATVVLINVLPNQKKAMATKAKSDIATIGQALEMYRLDNLTYPAAGEGLNALVQPPAGAAGQGSSRAGYIKKLPQDPWGRPYQYQLTSDGSYDVYSLGADGAPGGTGDNADIHGTG